MSTMDGGTAILTATSTFSTSFLLTQTPTPHITMEDAPGWPELPHEGTNIVINIRGNGGSTGKGILIGMLSAFGSAGFVALIFLAVYFFRYTSRGRIILDRIGRPGEYDDEQALAREEAEALEEMDDLQRAEYMRAKGMKYSHLNIGRSVEGVTHQCLADIRDPI